MKESSRNQKATPVELTQKLFDSLNVIFCAIDLQGKFVYLSKACYNIWGYHPEELIGVACYDLIIPEDRERSISNVVKVPHSQPFSGTFENRYAHKDGHIVTMLWEGGGYDEETALVYTAGRDVSEQRRLEQMEQAHQSELKAAKEELQHLVDRITDGFLGLDNEERVIYWNKAAENIAGLSQQTMTGHILWDVLPEPTRSLARQQLVVIKQTNKPLHIEYFSERIQRWMEVHAYISATGISVFFRDVTERKQLQEQLMQERELQRKRITHAVINATEEERAQVGKELHDNVNQVLTTVKLYTEICLSAPEKQEELLQRSAQLLQESINEIRGLSKRLSAPTLGRISLQDSIGELVEAVNASNRIKVQYLFKGGTLNIKDSVHVTIYRILQEHFTNIIKHAKATVVQLHVWKEKEALLIQATDNGQGFDTEQAHKGIGLANMNSRAESVNADLELRSTPGSGCVLRLRLPLTEHTKEPLK